MTRYRLSPGAQDAIHEIRQYLMGEAGARLARYVLSEIRAALNFIAANPGGGHRREDITDEPDAHLVVGSADVGSIMVRVANVAAS